MTRPRCRRRRRDLPQRWWRRRRTATARGGTGRSGRRRRRRCAAELDDLLPVAARRVSVPSLGDRRPVGSGGPYRERNSRPIILNKQTLRRRSLARLLSLSSHSALGFNLYWLPAHCQSGALVCCAGAQEGEEAAEEGGKAWQAEIDAQRQP